MHPTRAAGGIGAGPGTLPTVEATGDLRVPTPREYPSRWRARERRDRARIAWAVIRGRALEEPEDAALAVANARRRRSEGYALLARVAGVVFLLLGLWQLMAAPFTARGGLVWAVLGTLNAAIGTVCLIMPGRLAVAEEANLGVVERARTELLDEEAGRLTS